MTGGRGAVDPGTNEESADLRAELVQDLGDRLGPAVTMATTEHFNLQTARAATISEANGRASIYLTALSSNLIALAFIGQMSRLGTDFEPETIDRFATLAAHTQTAEEAGSGAAREGRRSDSSRSDRGASTADEP